MLFGEWSEMKKLLLCITIVIMLALLTSSLVSADLNVHVQVAFPTLSPFQMQQITATANERGGGIIFVIQPNTGTNWKDFIDSDSSLKGAWDQFDPSIKTQIDDAIGDNVVSYALVSWGLDGGSTNPPLAFPSADFTGINGQPSTGLLGTYKVLFVYGSAQLPKLFEVDFDCTEWNVIPEVPLGTAVASISLVVAAGAYALYRRRRFIKIP